MNIDFNKVKDDFYEYDVFDAAQYLQSAVKNYVTASFCYELIQKLIDKQKDEQVEFQQKLQKELNTQLEISGRGEVSIGEDDFPKGNFNLFELEIGYGFLLEKITKDFFQYARNIFDALGQFINSGLIANESKDNERVDFEKILKLFTKESLLTDFPLTSACITNIESSHEYTYLTHTNNRVKHIHDPKLIITQDLFGVESQFLIAPFQKKGQDHPEYDIITIVKNILFFCDQSIDSVYKSVDTEMKKRLKSSNRFHKLRCYAQIYTISKNKSFTVYYLEVNASTDELADELQLLLVSGDNQYAFEIDLDEILICVCADKEPPKCIGKFVAIEKPKKDGLHHYRKYKKEISNNGLFDFFKYMDKHYQYPLQASLTGYFDGGSVIQLKE